MRNALIILFIVFAFRNSDAQVFSVGDTSCNYQILNRNFSTYCYHPSLMFNSVDSDSLEVDVDSDLIYDFKIVSYCVWTPGGSSSTSTFYIKVVSLTNTEFAFKSPSLGGCSYSSTVANLSSGTPLDGSLSWSVAPLPSTTGNPSPFLYYSYSSPISGSWSCVSSSSNSFYLGFRKINSGDTIRGWALLSALSPGSVKSLAFKHSIGNNTVNPVFTSTVNEVCLGGAVALSGSPLGGVFNGTGVSGNVFNSITTGPGIHVVYYTLGCSTPAVKTITVHSPAIDFTNTQTLVCSGYSLALTASPTGGNFTGPGVSGNNFYSSSAGTTVISYSCTDIYGCSNTKTLAVNSLTAPILNVISTSSLSCPSESVTLTASGASSYTWSTGAQTYSIIVNPISTTVYTVVGEFSGGSCPASIITFTQAAGNPTLSLSGPAPTISICPGYYAGISASGAANYTWSTGATNYYISPQPTITTTYSVIGTNPAGCSGTASLTVNVYTPPLVNVTSSNSVVCAGQPITLYFNGGSGASYFEIADSASGIGSLMTPSSSIVMTPTNNITYRIRVVYGVTNSCFYDIFFRQNVKSSGNIIGVVPSKTLICTNDTVTLKLNGSKSYSVTMDFQTYTTNTSNLVVKPSTIPNLPYIVYGDSVIDGCQAVGFFTLNISNCVGIKENSGEIAQINIYPNPSSDEFEIKGIKEDVIFVSNELGQLIYTKYLNPENNFSVKIKNLQNGVYFVGNKFFRQKVVVIK